MQEQMQSGEVRRLADDPSTDDGVACHLWAMQEICSLGVPAAAAAAAAAAELEGGAAQVYQLPKPAVYGAVASAELVRSTALLASVAERQRPYLALAPGRAPEASIGSAACQVFCAVLDGLR